ncbi:MAG: FAD-dependent oxidoreductase [Dehalococcoidia bacterium]|nr:FAD-dependent oxidoreductase [Dehalococcoidia bacterium]
MVKNNVITDEKQDVLILGAGIAGLVAAVEAARAGSKVTILDKLEPMVGKKLDKLYSTGGTANDTYRAGGGGIARFALDGPIEELLQRHWDMGWGRVDMKLMRAYLENVDKDCLWLRDDLKIPYQKLIGGVRVQGKGPAICPFFYKVCEQLGIRIIFQTKALKLITEKGRVTGARVRNSNGEFDFKARAVILATGSFTGNHEMMIKYVGPEMSYIPLVTGCTQNTGDGLLMAMELGARLENLSVCHVRTTDKLLGTGPSRHLVNIYPRGIYINRNCQRFIDEGTADSDMIGNAIVYQPGLEAALIFDDKARSLYPEEYDTYPKKNEAIQVAQNLDELAVKINLPPEKLKEVIGDFNAAVDNGKAVNLPFPKTAKAFTIDKPPFYAFSPVWPGLNHPLGGLKINTRAEVLDLDNEPIPGLFAAGSIVNWAFGKTYQVGDVTTFKGSYHAGSSGGLAVALVFGRWAGMYAARTEKP